ncbi:MAG: cation diffusion facilitator family transporter [Parvibaculum sp.]|nr:cation diffusion facilitator family transporter [Parvibaculum sp.]|tara:strand:+ start:3858 stop:4781 length:924 start_codon:yes stop_codon:yes gene_type:complete
MTTQAERASAAVQHRLMRQATYAAVAIAIMLIGMKSVALYLTGSVAMLGTLADSVLDGAASLLNLFAVRLSMAPADHEHRFGHGKAEALAGLGQSIFIFVSAGFIGWQSVHKLLNPVAIENSSAGVAVIIVALVLTLGLVAFQRHVVARTGSLAIAADSIHYRGDLLMNLSALGAIFLSGFLGLFWADAVGGLIIAALIAFSATQIALAAYGQLMDAELGDGDRTRIADIAKANTEVVDIHDLRTRAAGMQTFIQFHLELDGKMTLSKAHRISDEVEARIIEAFPGAEVIIHQDPAGLEDVSEEERI